MIMLYHSWAHFQKECMSAQNRDSCIPMFIAPFFTVAKLCNWYRFPSTDEYIKKMWYIYTVKYNSATKKSEIMSVGGKWMEPKVIMLKEIFHTQKDRCQMFSFM
jgi:hypothetical protein